MGYGRESMLERPGMLIGCFVVLSAIFATDPNIDFLSRQERQSEIVLRKARRKLASSDKSP